VPGIVVLGMHRSGTSAVSRIVNLLGAGLGPDEDLLTEFDNPAGHWESMKLNRCNDRILAAFGRSWDFPPWFGTGWERSARATQLLPDMAETFAAIYSSEPWVWKDPRNCLTLPLWRRVLEPDPIVILVSRNPGAVTASIHRRDGIPSLYGAGLWQHYVRAAVAGAAGLPVVCMQFEDLVRSPVPIIEGLVDDLQVLGVDLHGDPEVAARSLRDDLVHGSHHHAMVDRLTSSTVAVLRSLPRRSEVFEPPSWREPRWVRPLMVAYRGPWAMRARAGRPLRPGVA
jgi:hypothetical protein